jgi:Ca2+/H+ antiporter
LFLGNSNRTFRVGAVVNTTSPDTTDYLTASSAALPNNVKTPRSIALGGVLFTQVRQLLQAANLTLTLILGQVTFTHTN